MDTFVSTIAALFSSVDFYISFSFWAALAAVVVAVRLLPKGSRIKPYLMLASSIGMLLLLPRITAPILLVFVGLCVVSYSAGSLLNSAKVVDAGSRKLIAAAGVVAVIAVLAFFKYRFVQEAVLAPFTGFRASEFIFLLGVSYSSFKAIHFIIEGFKKTIKGGTFLDFLNYMFFFPSFVSGPINRFNHFVENSDAGKSKPFRDDLWPGLERIIHGLFKKTVLTTLIFPYTINRLSTPIEDMPAWMILGGLYAFAIYSFLDFSGYTDMALGCARLLGYALPENFDFPFLQRNIQQLWAHWHMSLSTWLTDYIYWPLVRRMRKTQGFREHPLLVSNIAIIITFFICGVWHGEGANFILWGLFQGVGIAAVNVYQNWKRRVRDPRALRYFRSSLSHYAGVFGTFNFFAMGLVMFVLDARQIEIIFRRLTAW